MQIWHHAKLALPAVGLVAILLSACAGPSPEQQKQADAAKAMTNAELQATLVDHTISGKSKKGPSYSEYYDPNGQIRGLWGGKERYAGSWRLKGDEFCVDYEGTDSDGCWAMAISGDNVYWLEDGVVTNTGNPAALAQGNPNRY